MRRKLIWMPVGIITFLLGVGSLLLFRFPFSQLPVQDSPQGALAVDLVTCTSSTQFPGRSIELKKLQVSTAGYFPAGLYGGHWRGRDDVMNTWYSKHLRAMHEPSLIKEYRSDTEVYRFLWLRTFHNPIAVRIEREHSRINLFLNELDGSGGYEPGRIIAFKQLPLDRGQWCGFMAALERANYWNEPLEREDLGNDGSQWILEGVRDGRYHLVDRWTPQDGSYREACLYLLELAGVETDKLGNDFY